MCIRDREKPNYRFGDDMMNSIERKIIADGVAFNNIKVNRFKTIRMSINPVSYTHLAYRF